MTTFILSALQPWGLQQEGTNDQGWGEAGDRVQRPPMPREPASSPPWAGVLKAPSVGHLHSLFSLTGTLNARVLKSCRCLLK